MDRTLVICKPDAVERGLVGEIVGRLERKGLKLVAAELRTIDVDTARRHYDEHSEKPFFGELVEFITGSPVLLVVVEGPDDTWRVVRTLMGPTNPLDAPPGTIRGEPGPRERRPRVGETGDPALLPPPLRVHGSAPIPRRVNALRRHAGGKVHGRRRARRGRRVSRRRGRRGRLRRCTASR